jgi:hypothetical protein
VAAEMALDDFEFPLAISLFRPRRSSSTLHNFNLLMIDRDQARDYLLEAVRLGDWFQLGYVEYVEARYQQVLDAYIKCLRCMRSSRDIVYE